MNKLEKQVRKLRADGYLPIVTFQAAETDMYQPAPAQGGPDFRRMAKAGAVVVSGSQSHVPQTMTLVNTGDDSGASFVHYGLGNLFFDQMSPPRSREEFIDRHVFYDGRYLGARLLTALLEDYSRPRPMTVKERGEFLQAIFALCNWKEE
jgi:poly-gamma-glutamate synthesis protein (capsule biosynthesis protein)